MPENWNDKIWVMVPCIQDWIEESKVECIDVYEDASGRDMLIFKCPLCGETHKSFRCNR